MEDVAVVIAHNAAFDRGFVEARLPFFQKKAWGCSYAQMPWKVEGFGSASLEFLAYKFGFYFTDSKKVAESYANNLTETDKEQVIQSYFLNIRKLADIFDKNYKYVNDELGWDFNEELGYNQYISKEDISLKNILDSINLSLEDFKDYVIMLNRSLYNDIKRLLIN